MSVYRLVDQFIESIDSCPWEGCSGRSSQSGRAQGRLPVPLYTAEQRRRRDESPWTMVQGILAPLQFLVFLVSLVLVLHFLATGNGLAAATISVVVKTLTLYAIMITGSIWEREVFGKYLFAPAFFWEDVISILVLLLHSLYIGALFSGTLNAHALMLLALTAYASYLVNATQFVFKLRAARKNDNCWAGSQRGMLGAAR